MSKHFSVDITGSGNLISGMIVTEGMNRYKNSTWYERSDMFLKARSTEVAIGKSGYGDAAAKELAERITHNEATRKASDVEVRSYQKDGFEVTEISGPGHQKVIVKFKQDDLKDFKDIDCQVKKVLDAIEHVMRWTAVPASV